MRQGTFLVRPSLSLAGTMVLSVVVDGVVKHMALDGNQLDTRSLEARPAVHPVTLHPVTLHPVTLPAQLSPARLARSLSSDRLRRCLRPFVCCSWRARLSITQAGRRPGPCARLSRV